MSSPSSLPIVCGCFVVAHLTVVPNNCVISATIVEVNADSLSVMRVVDNYDCFVMISINTLATFAAVASISGQAFKSLEETSISVITVCYPPLVGEFGNKLICMASSGPRSLSGKLNNSGVIALLGTGLSLAHLWHRSTHFLTCFSTPW